MTIVSNIPTFGLGIIGGGQGQGQGQEAVGKFDEESEVMGF